MVAALDSVVQFFEVVYARFLMDQLPGVIAL